MSRGARRLASGLTLLEMMVVLMIAGMALALGYQSLAQWRRAEASISGMGSALRADRLSRLWFESSVNGLVPVDKAPFSGQPGSLSGYTTRPVVAGQGGLTAFNWEIDTEARTLVLDEDGRQLQLPLPAAATSRFVYFDREGKEYDQWPPKLGLATHLPAAVALVQPPDAADERPRYWMAAVSGKLDPIEILMYEPETD